MGFLLAENDAQPPPWPHVVCAGDASLAGRGWAWHDDERRRRCFQCEIPAPAPLVAAAIDGRELAGLERVRAIVQLKEEAGGTFLLRLFRQECPVCGGDHYERAKRAIRVWTHIHPGAHERLRAARVPEDLLAKPYYRRVGQPETPEDVKQKLRFLPVWLGEPDRTLAAQLAFARQYALRKGTAHVP